jgi:hypothetical protein
MITICQSPEQDTTLAKTDYLKKSKNQKTTAWVLVCGGAALMLTGALIPQGEFTSSGNFWDDLWGGGHYENDETRSAFGTAGFLAMLGSIPFFVSARKNKRQAAALSIKNERIPMLQQGSFVYQPIPSLTLKFSL